MGKSQKYSDELLTKALIKFADTHSGKIKYTELADWARNNVQGLEEVKDYHFSREIIDKDGKKKKKNVTRRIEEINSQRSYSSLIKGNELFSMVNIDKFFEAPNSSQRKMLAEARALFQKVVKENKKLNKQLSDYEINSIINTKELAQLGEEQKKIEKKIQKFDKIVNWLKKRIDEKQEKEVLKEIGISDGEFNIDTYKNSLINDTFDISKMISEYQKVKMEDKILQVEDITKEIIKGLSEE